MKKAILTILCILPLTGCLSREQADANLQKGCEAAVAFFIEEGFTIKNIKRATFKPSTEFGNGYREVTLFAAISDGWLDLDKEYKCSFAEEMNAITGAHRADIYQIDMDGEIFGAKDGKLTGDMQTQINLNEAVQNAMQ